MVDEATSRPVTLEIVSALRLAEWLALGPKRYAESLTVLERIARWLAPITDDLNVQRVFKSTDGYTKTFVSLMAEQARSGISVQIAYLRSGGGSNVARWDYNVALFMRSVPFLRVLNGEVAAGDSPEVSSLEQASEFAARFWGVAAAAALAATFLPAVLVAAGEMVVAVGAGAATTAAVTSRVTGELLAKVAPGAVAWFLTIYAENPQLVTSATEWGIGTILTIKTNVSSLEDLKDLFSDPQFVIQFVYDVMVLRIVAANGPRITRPARIARINGDEIEVILVEEQSPPGSTRAKPSASTEEEPSSPRPPTAPSVRPPPDPAAVLKRVPNRTPGEEAALQQLSARDPNWTEAIAEEVTSREVETYRKGTPDEKNGIVSRHQGALQERLLPILREFQDAWAKATELRDNLAAQVKRAGSQLGSIELLRVRDAAGELTDGLIGAVESRADGSQRLHVFFVFEVKSISNLGDLLRNVPKAQSFVSGQVENSRARLETNPIIVRNGGAPRTFRVEDVQLAVFDYKGVVVRSKWFVVAPYDARTDRGFKGLVKRLEKQGRPGVDVITSPLRNLTLRNLADAILTILAGDS
jgi:hypothetical protein